MSTPPFVDLPQGVRRTSLRTDRGELAALEAVPESTPIGEIVLVPGFTGSKEDFVAVLAPLAAKGWRVLTYDQLGQHESTGPHDEEAYAVAELALDLARVCSTWCLREPHIVGHSYGGLVAAHAVLEDPDAFASLTLLCSGPGALPPERHGSLGLLRELLPQTDLDTIFEAEAQMTREAGGTPPDGEIGAFMKRRFVANHPLSLRALAGHLMVTPNRTDDLATAAANGLAVHVIYGENDDAWPIEVQDEVARRCGVDPVAVPRTGHSPCAEDPEAAVVAIDAELRGLSPVVAG